MKKFRHGKTLSWTFSSLGCPELSLEEVVAMARSHGIHMLELRALDSRLDLPAVFEAKYETPEKLSTYLDAAGMKVVALDTSLRLIRNNQDDREEFLRFLPWAEALGGVGLRVFDGGSYAPALSSSDLQAALETTKWWQETREQNGWKSDILIETHDALTSSDALLTYLKELDAPPPILWDTHHTWKRAGEDPLETWERIGTYVRHIHVKDSVSEPSHNHPYQYRFLGEGEFPLEPLLEKLEEVEFAGPVSIEWERKWHPYLEPLSIALERAQNAGLWAART